MACKLVPTDAYRQARYGLSKSARAALEYAVEPAIAEDPDHRIKRRERADGAVIDYSAQRLFVAFRRLGPDTVQLLEVIDLKEADRRA